MSSLPSGDPSSPVGRPLPHWRSPPPPPRVPLAGRYCHLEPLDPAVHAAPLWVANQGPGPEGLWTYLPYGPFATEQDYRSWLEEQARSADPLFFAILDPRRAPGPAGAVGLAAYLRITPAQGCIEVGHLAYSPLLQRTPAATESMYLLMRQAFDLGYRRYEWKCDTLNAPSRAAALRLGFQFEGIFRQAAVVKGRNRDTAWYSVIDSEWPALRNAFERWLDPANFDPAGRQRAGLASLRAGRVAG